MSATPIRVDADVKLDTKILADVAASLESFAPQMFKQRAGRWMAVVELAHVERTEPGPEEEKNPTVKVRITQIEVAGSAVNDEHLRHLLLDLYQRRTAEGTLDEHAA